MNKVINRCLFPLLLASIAFGQGPTSRHPLVFQIENGPIDLELLEPGVALLEDADPKIQLQAARMWESLLDPYIEAVFDKINDANADDNDGDLNKYDALYDRASEQLLQNLTKLANSSDQRVRLQAIRTLCLSSDSALRLVINNSGGCLNMISYTIEYRADRVLAKLARSNRPELEFLLNDSHPDVVFNAIRALELPYSDQQLPTIKRFLRSSDLKFVATGMELLEKAPVAVQAQELAPLIEREDELRSRQVFIRFTASGEEFFANAQPAHSRTSKFRMFMIQHFPYDSIRAEHVLKELIKDSDPEIRRAALERLLGGSNLDFKPYAYLLDDPAPEVQGAALKIAFYSKTKGLLPYFKKAIVSESKELREDAIGIASEIPGSREFTTEIIQAIKLNDHCAYDYAPAFDDSRFSHLLEECVRSESRSLRLLALNYFNLPSSFKNLELLNMIALDKDYRVAMKCVEVFMTFDKKRAVEIVERIVRTNPNEAGYEEAGLLAESKIPEAIPILELMAGSKDDQARFQGKRFLVDLKKALKP